MKFMIKPQEEKELVVQLKLRENPNGTTSLRGYAGNTEKTLMRFEDGKIIRLEHAKLPGIATDDKGRILEKVL